VIVAQRLLRRLCPLCKAPHDVDTATAQRFQVPASATLYRAVGCRECRESGYRGRLGVFEVIRINKELQGLIEREAPLVELRQAAVDDGMKLLANSAMDKACEGLTSLQEVVSVTVSD
jgi:type IV pilus assembly protein PilB